MDEDELTVGLDDVGDDGEGDCVEEAEDDVQRLHLSNLDERFQSGTASTRHWRMLTIRSVGNLDDLSEYDPREYVLNWRII